MFSEDSIERQDKWSLTTEVCVPNARGPFSFVPAAPFEDPTSTMKYGGAVILEYSINAPSPEIELRDFSLSLRAFARLSLPAYPPSGSLVNLADRFVSPIVRSWLRTSVGQAVGVWSGTCFPVILSEEHWETKGSSKPAIHTTYRPAKCSNFPLARRLFCHRGVRSKPSWRVCSKA